MKKNNNWWIRIPLIFFIVFGLMEYFVDSGEQPAFLEYPIMGVFLLLVLVLLIGVELVVNGVENVLFQSLSEEAKARYLEDKAESRLQNWFKKVYQRLTRSRPIEEEGEIILDHNYDGIKELDNRLPPWWVYMFYLTILFGVIYMVRFHIFGDYTQDQEFEQKMAEAQLELEEYKRTAKDLVDASTVVLLTDAADLSAGKTLFNANCAVCHKEDMGGSIGPNLTDPYWILGGGIQNVFRTVSEGGRDGKGMVAWKNTLKPGEIAQVSSYVLSLQGSTPADPKAAEGELWVDPNAPQPLETAADTLGVATGVESPQ